MRSFATAVWAATMLAAGLKVKGAVLEAPTPVITPSPCTPSVETFAKRDDPDAISLAQILLTALPASLRIIAATNVPAVSSILWAEFLDGKRPEWFNQLPADIQSYLIRNFGPSTAWPTAIPTTSGSNSAETTHVSTTQISETTSELFSETSSPTNSNPSVTMSGQLTANPTATSTNPSTVIFSPTSTANASGGLSRNQKIGIGLGVPLAILGAAAILLACCVLLRRRRKKGINGSQPPSSPGFIPRFAFQEKGEHHTPLNRERNLGHFSQDTSYSNAFNWDDDIIEPTVNTQISAGNTLDNHTAPTIAPAAAPSLYHTHSSNRARGKRTSYSSLHSVAEVREPDESPVLPRESFRPSAPRRLSSGLILGASQTKRKPVSFPNTTLSVNPRSNTSTIDEQTGLATAAATVNLLRPSIPHSNNNSDSTQSSTSAPSSISPVPFTHSSTNIPISPVSPISSISPMHTTSFTPPAPASSLNGDTPPRNPFLNDYYVEDYGPEYTHVFPYDDLENGLYGGHTDLSRYPEYDQVAHPKLPSRNVSKTEWPLKNALSGRRRNKSPLWDRVYDG